MNNNYTFFFYEARPTEPFRTLIMTKFSINPNNVERVNSAEQKNNYKDKLKGKA